MASVSHSPIVLKAEQSCTETEPDVLVIEMETASNSGGCTSVM